MESSYVDMYEWPVGSRFFVPCQTTYKGPIEWFPVHVVDNITEDSRIPIVYLAILVEIIHHVIFRILVYEYVQAPPQRCRLYFTF